MNKKLPLVLLVLDGWGLAPASKYNAVSQAKTPVYLNLIKTYPSIALSAHGETVGLSPDQVGNSQAGHMSIGAGRTIIQDSVLISQNIRNKSFFENSALLKSIKHVKKNDSIMHLIGILSGSQCSHMHPEHVQALLELLYKNKVKNIVLHFLTDGYDSFQKSALDHWSFFSRKLRPNVLVGSICGRFYLDRKKKWHRTEKIYSLLTQAKADFKADSIEQAIVKAYARGEKDEFISPTIIKHKKACTINNKDSVIFFHLRSDRAKQLTQAFTSPEFEGFTRKKFLPNLLFTALTDFGPANVLTVFPGKNISSTLPMSLSCLRQVYIGETEKYAHITYFFNGGYNDPVGGESRILVKSPDVKFYNKVPAMSLADIVNITEKSIEKNLYDVYVINFANADMLGHSGDLKAVIKACEAIDYALGKIYLACAKQKGVLIVTSDHGNAEQMKDLETGKIHTFHTRNKVPFILADPVFYNKKFKKDKYKNLSLINVAPTILDLLNLPVPVEMKSQSLVSQIF